MQNVTISQNAKREHAECKIVNIQDIAEHGGNRTTVTLHWEANEQQGARR
jgi:hypothetical protein